MDAKVDPGKYPSVCIELPMEEKDALSDLYYCLDHAPGSPGQQFHPNTCHYSMTLPKQSNSY